MASIRSESPPEWAPAWSRAYAGAGGPPTAEEPGEGVGPASRPPAAAAPAPRPGASGAHPIRGADRACADALAAWRRWHPPAREAAARFAPREQAWYGVLERARVEALAARHLPGMATNLSRLDALAPAHPGLAELYRAARAAFEPGPGAALPDLQAARHLLGDGVRFAGAVTPLVRRLASEAPEGPPESPAAPPAAAGDPAAPPVEEDDEAALERPGGAAPEPEHDGRFPGYAVYSRSLDEEDRPSRWLRPEDARALTALSPLDRRRVRRLAHRLQRQLLAARLRHWSFDREEGRLDARRLARLVGDRPAHRVFRAEEEAPVPDACVSLLVDQSGSMRRPQRQMAVLAVDLAVHTLERCGLACEVLGFTTRYGPGGPLYRRWRGGGGGSRPPGRLNALRHIRYKTAREPWRRTRARLALLLRDDFGRENVDGEALDWAAGRLARRPEPRKVLVVLSDGAPHDADTEAANGRGFLAAHLRQVVSAIEASGIRLVAIGAGQDVARFYRRSVTVRRPEEVADVLFERLGALLTDPDPEQVRLR